MRHIILTTLLLCGCASGQGISLMPYEHLGEGPEEFAVCHGFGCSQATAVNLTAQQWASVTKPLAGKAKSPEAERVQIAKAIARMERAVQEATQMSADLGEAHTFEKDQHQMDCLDETINSSRYLKFFADKGFLHHHEVADPLHRGFFVDGMWPHNSAAVREKDTGGVYAIDSYYSDNGEKVHVVEKREWLAEWRPEGLEPTEAPRMAKKVPPKPARKPMRKA